MIGETLKHYRIESLLGKGGMGEVYLARDSRLGRSVALKVLPGAFAHEADRISRFEREAKLLAALNHPNIAALYGMEEDSGRHFLVMELVEGETLGERLHRGALPVSETLRIAHQIVEALESAHEKGIIHRDLKPPNVKLTPEGKVKVLDFGLAKAMEPGSGRAAGSDAFSHSPTMSMAATNAGIILGTAAYMSPEQANGLPADARSDLFSFGSLLFEMLTGRQPFQGKTLSEVLAAVLVRDPDWSALPTNLHPRIQELVRRCLEKEPRRRWHAAGDVRVEIEKLIADPGGLEPLPQSSSKLRPLWRRAIPVLAGALAAAVLASVATWSLRPTVPEPTVTRFSFALPQDQSLNPFNVAIAISPDGTKLVSATLQRLYMRQMAESEARPIPGTEGAGTPVFFSPDGQWIGFWSIPESTLKKVAVTGGASIPICKCSNPMGIQWDKDWIVWSEVGKGILRVSENGGEPEVLVSVKAGEYAHGPQILDDGRAVLFTLSAGTSLEAWDAAQIVVQPLPMGERKVVLRGGSDARYLPSGHLVYAVGGNLLAVPFDVKKLETRGGSVVVLEGVMRPFLAQTGGANLSLSANGTLAYVPGSSLVTSRNVLAFADKTGKIETLPLTPGPYTAPRISPDGKQIAYQRGEYGGASDVWIYELARRSPRKLTLDAKSALPVWTSDSRRVIFNSRGALSWQPADGTGPAEPLTKPEIGVDFLPQAVSGAVLAFTPFRGSFGGISLVSLNGERKIDPFLDVPNGLRIHAAFSPDGRWLAYMELKQGTAHVFVEPFPRTSAKYQVTTEGGATPLWSLDGKQLFYVNLLGRLFVVDVQTEPQVSFSQPKELPIRGALFPTPGLLNYDIAKDGRLLVVLPAALDPGAAQPSAQIHVVLNWLEELKQRVPVQ